MQPFISNLKYSIYIIWALCLYDNLDLFQIYFYEFEQMWSRTFERWWIHGLITAFQWFKQSVSNLFTMFFFNHSPYNIRESGLARDLVILPARIQVWFQKVLLIMNVLKITQSCSATTRKASAYQSTKTLLVAF